MNDIHNPIDADIGLPLSVVRADIAQGEASRTAGLGTAISDSEQHRLFFENIIARGRARAATRDRD